MIPTCFISHTWRGGEHHFAMRLADALKQKKIEVWIDEEQITPGTHIKERIKKGIMHNSDAFLIVMSPEALNSEMVKYELELALNQMEEYCKAIIPVLFKECEIPDFLEKICYADFRNPLYFDAALERLIKGIKHSAEVRDRCANLNHPNLNERIKTSEELGDLKNFLALGCLKNRLLSEESDPEVRYWLAIAIGEIGGKKAVNILAQAIEQEKDPFARLGIIDGMIEAFESLDNDEFNRVKSILFNLKNAPDNIVRTKVKEYCKKKGV